MPTFPEPIFLQYSLMMAQNPSFLLNSPFLTPTFPKEPNLATNPLFLQKCSFPAIIFSKSPILPQILSKRSFLVPISPKPIFPQYSLMRAQNQFFLHNSPFRTLTFPKEPNLAQNNFFLPNSPFLTPTFPKEPNLARNFYFLLNSPFPTPTFLNELSLAQILLFVFMSLSYSHFL